MIGARGNTKMQRGMTLIEVLVAMAILAAVAGSVMMMTAQSLRLGVVVEDRLIARILADNAAVNALASENLQEIKSQREEINYAGKRWTVDRSLVNAGIDGVYKLTIAVKLDDGDQVLARIETLKAAPS